MCLRVALPVACRVPDADRLKQQGASHLMRSRHRSRNMKLINKQSWAWIVAMCWVTMATVPVSTLQLGTRLNLSWWILAPFACLIIRTFQLVFSVETIFFSHNKPANSTFNYSFSAKRTGFLLFFYSVDLERVNRSYLMLLPKKHGATATATDAFRPICLQNCSVKSIAKILIVKRDLQPYRSKSNWREMNDWKLCICDGACTMLL
jgi:hypothetical protein